MLLLPVGLADGCELVVSPAVEVDLGGASGAVPAGLPASELHTRVPGHSRGKSETPAALIGHRYDWKLSQQCRPLADCIKVEENSPQQ